jgi:hypothetical protein
MNLANVLKNPATHWEATRWRLRLLVRRVSSFVPVPRTHYALGPIGTVAATGKRSARFWRRHDGDCAFWLGRVSSFVPVPRTHYALGRIRTVAATGKRSARSWRPHDGDCAFWWGESVASCQCLGHITRWGVFGQSPLPGKDPRDFGGHTMATAPFGGASQ